MRIRKYKDVVSFLFFTVITGNGSIRYGTGLMNLPTADMQRTRLSW